MTDHRKEHQVPFRETTRRPPSNADLDALFSTVTRVRVFASGKYRKRAIEGDVLADVSAPSSLLRLRDVLRIEENPSSYTTCDCAGGPTLEFHAGESRVAAIGLQHGRAIRWSRWTPDAGLKDGEGLNRWLVEHGVERGFLDIFFVDHEYRWGRLPTGLRAPGPAPLSRLEQRVRLVELGRWSADRERSLQVFEEIRTLEPTNEWAWAVRGRFHQELGGDEEAERCYSEAIRLGLETPKIVFLRGEARRRLGRYELAVEDFSRDIATRPGNFQSYERRGVTLMKLGRFEEALRDLDVVVRRSPKRVSAYRIRAEIHGLRNDPSAAEADLDWIRLLERSKTDPAAGSKAMPPRRVFDHERCAASLMGLGRFEDALVEIDEALSHMPGWISAHLRRAEIYVAMGRPSDAIADLDLVDKFGRAQGGVEAYSLMATACELRAEAYLAIGEGERATMERRKAARLAGIVADLMRSKSS